MSDFSLVAYTGGLLACSLFKPQLFLKIEYKLAFNFESNAAFQNYQLHSDVHHSSKEVCCYFHFTETLKTP